MNNCYKCGGLQVDPGDIVGWGGKFCYCRPEEPLKPVTKEKIHMGDVSWCECSCHTQGSPQPDCEKCYSTLAPKENEALPPWTKRRVYIVKIGDRDGFRVVLEDDLIEELDQARKTERARLAKEVRKVFNIITPDGFESPEMCLNELAALEEGFVKLLKLLEDTHLKQIEGM